MIKRLLQLTLIFFVLTISALTAGYFYIDEKANQLLNIKSPEIVTISQGTSISSFSRLLVKKGWIDSRLWLKAYVKLRPDLASLKKGTYSIPTGINTIELLTLLVSGKEHQYSITFIEGSTFKDWLAVLSANANLVHNVSDLEVEEIAKRLGLSQTNPEGLFFPDTYAFTIGTSELDILKRANQKMAQQLSTFWNERADNLPYSSAYEALIMASIIEKESGKHSEQPIISSVFVNRLNKRMRLQTDPTVIYGLGDRYKGDIKRSHLKEKTAYNTYRIDGLPPTPIAMPGLLALKAVMHPSTTNYFYFVSNGNGKHVFSKTLKEHNKAVAAYLRATRSK